MQLPWSHSDMPPPPPPPLPGNCKPSQLSAITTETSSTVKDRKEAEMLRPIYLNGVEVGYAYAQSETDKRFAVRGLTIALFHFLAAGHQVLALLPHCFKLYPDKSTNHEELMALHRLNLVEFTPGYGSDKYVEVNRLGAGAAVESGGCIVARSQMHSIVNERPALEDVVERRLLMPSFMGDDIIFPIDGPLGRRGPTLADTLVCSLGDADYNSCALYQLTAEDQLIWIQHLSSLLPEKYAWESLASRLSAWKPERVSFHPPAALAALQIPVPPPMAGPIRPPETNPPHGRGFSHARRGSTRYNGRDYYHCPARLRIAPETEEEDDDSLLLPSYARGPSLDAMGDSVVPSVAFTAELAGNKQSRPTPLSLPPFSSAPPPEFATAPRQRAERHPFDIAESLRMRSEDDGKAAHIGHPGSLYKIASVDEMAKREVPPPRARSPPPHRPRASTAFDRIPPLSAPRRFDRFSSSPPRSNSYTNSFGQTRSYGQVQTRENSSISNADSNDRHPCFSQLAAILGFEKAKALTTAHPRETDINKLCNLAFDDGSTAASSNPAGDDNTTMASSAASPSSDSTSTSSGRRHLRRGGRGGRQTAAPSPPPPPSSTFSLPALGIPRSDAMQGGLNSGDVPSETTGVEENLIDWDLDPIAHAGEAAHEGANDYEPEASTHLLDL